MLLTFSVSQQEGNALLRNFLRAHGVSASLMRSVKTHGGFFCEGQPIHTNMRVKAGQNIAFALPPERDTSTQPQQLPLHIVYEDAHTMLLDKPAGMTVHPTLGYPDGTLANAFCGEMHRRGTPRAFRPINRIDRNTSGLVLCALNEYAAPILAAGAEKMYLAIAQGTLPDAGIIDAPIGLEEGSFIKHCVCEGGKPSQTRYETIARGGGLSLARVWTITGRTHQIRVHFAYLGCPLAGDDLYGGSQEFLSRHALHCAQITFPDVATVGGLCPEKTGCEPTAAMMPDGRKNEAENRRTVCLPVPPDLSAVMQEKLHFDPCSAFAVQRNT